MAVVWLLIGPKTGDNQQLRTLGDLLTAHRSDVVVVEKAVAYRATELLTNRLCGPNLHGLLPGCRAQLAPPWPDVLLTAGRRNEPVARWIQQQAAPQPVKLVHVGRPWTHPTRFDAILTTRQYQLPPAAHVHWLDLPLHRITPARLATAGRTWAPTFAPLPAPRIGVLLGGNSGALTFHPAHAAQLGRQLDHIAAQLGGTLLVTASRRTPPAALAALERGLTGSHVVFPFGQTPNPYLAVLAMADVLVVTADSASMLAEACATQTPVYVVDLRARHLPWWQRWRAVRWPVISHQLAMGLAPRRFRRALPKLIGELMRCGRVQWLAPTATRLVPPAVPAVDCGGQDRQRAWQALRPLLPNAVGAQLPVCQGDDPTDAL